MNYYIILLGLLIQLVVVLISSITLSEKINKLFALYSVLNFISLFVLFTLLHLNSGVFLVSVSMVIVFLVQFFLIGSMGNIYLITNEVWLKRIHVLFTTTFFLFILSIVFKNNFSIWFNAIFILFLGIKYTPAIKDLNIQFKSTFIFLFIFNAFSYINMMVYSHYIDTTSKMIESFDMFILIHYLTSIFTLLSYVQIAKLIIIDNDLVKSFGFRNTIKILNEIIAENPTSVVLTDLNGNIVFCNKKAQNLTGYNQDEIVGRNARMFQSGNTPIEVYRDLWKSLKTKGSWKGDLYNKKKNGELYTENVNIVTIAEEDVPIYYLAIKTDVTFERSLTNNLAILANFDELTGAFRRTKFVDKITELYGFYEDTSYLALIDIDQFKEINDNYGHVAGDTILVNFVKTANTILGGNGVVCRLGGDEFACYIFGVSGKAAIKLVRDIQRMVNDYKISDYEGLEGYHVSVGLTKIIELLSFTDIYNNADKLLYKAKSEECSTLITDIK